MKCGICKAEMEKASVTYTEDTEQGVVVIRHVPAEVCTECGNTWYSGAVAGQLEKMIDQFIGANISAEVSVLNFTKTVA
ncbi:MAG: type II toxin-antitoxin system MqsA family antitoxin [Spirochaetota bacterium]|jgi:YgiT-type zinc finger domain-containing protein|nr:type II toxin-antitoxin system MqsA family antitoxin [Spirochaetota bacterium]